MDLNNICKHRTACAFLGALNQFFSLAGCIWSILNAVHLHALLYPRAKIMSYPISTLMHSAHAIAWGSSSVMVVILIAVDAFGYAGEDTSLDLASPCLYIRHSEIFRAAQAITAGSRSVGSDLGMLLIMRPFYLAWHILRPYSA